MLQVKPAASVMKQENQEIKNIWAQYYLRKIVNG